MIYDARESARGRQWKNSIPLRYDPERVEIRKVLDRAMRDNQLLVAVFDQGKNLVYQGVKVMGSVWSDFVDDREYQLTNSDSGYKMPVGFVELRNVGYVHTL